MVASPVPFATKLTPQPEWPAGKPVPIHATFNPVNEAWAVTFDKELQPGVLDHGSWTFSYGAIRNVATSAVASGAIVSGLSEWYNDNPLDTQVEWWGDPADVISMRGEHADRIYSFPLT